MKSLIFKELKRKFCQKVKMKFKIFEMNNKRLHKEKVFKKINKIKSTTIYLIKFHL